MGLPSGLFSLPHIPNFHHHHHHRASSIGAAGIPGIPTANPTAAAAAANNMILQDLLLQSILQQASGIGGAGGAGFPGAVPQPVTSTAVGSFPPGSNISANAAAAAALAAAASAQPNVSAGQLSNPYAAASLGGGGGGAQNQDSFGQMAAGNIGPIHNRTGGYQRFTPY